MKNVTIWPEWSQIMKLCYETSNLNDTMVYSRIPSWNWSKSFHCVRALVENFALQADMLHSLRLTSESRIVLGVVSFLERENFPMKTNQNLLEQFYSLLLLVFCSCLRRAKFSQLSLSINCSGFFWSIYGIILRVQKMSQCGLKNPW